MPDKLAMVKIGGSLLDLPDLPRRLARFSAGVDGTERDGLRVYIVGGGRIVDEVRKFDSQHGLTPKTIHYASLLGMAANGMMVAEKLGWPLIDADDHSLESSSPLSGKDFVWNVLTWKRGFEFESAWELTSDSLAALLAKELGASELVLLKSHPPPSTAWAELSRAGYIDGEFPEAASGLPAVRFVDLRGDEYHPR